jgi:hypothetical protein
MGTGMGIAYHLKYPTLDEVVLNEVPEGFVPEKSQPFLASKTKTVTAQTLDI